MNELAIIGAGKWGQGLQFAYSQKCRAFISSRTPKKLENFISFEEAMNFEYLIFALPAQACAAWLHEHFIFTGQKVMVASKGIDVQSGRFLNEIFETYLPRERLAFLTGPSFAAEVVRSLPTALVVNSVNAKLAQEYAQCLPDFIKGYVDDDLIGAEIAGAYKNVIAIAGGICDGLELGNNARAALLARGLVEMTRFAVAHGARQETFLSLSGAGDLFLTASSTLSRNYRVGLGLAQKKPLDDILDEIGEVAEGVYTARALFDRSQKNDIYIPIATEVYRILQGKDPHTSLVDLLKHRDS